MKIVFMGTPEFAVPSLQKLINSEHSVVGVVTVPDKPAGRGQKLRLSAVKQKALEYSIPVLQPVDLKDLSFKKELEKLNADLFVVVAFRILPPSIFTLPKSGTFNLHASLLPKYRGAAPINWALINGENESGVTTFFIDEKVDTGEILFKESVGISPNMSAGELHDFLMEIGSSLVLKTVNEISNGTAVPQVQQGEPTKAPKLTKELCLIDWSKSASEIHNLVRGLSPYPSAFTFYNNKQLKILSTQHVEELTDNTPGTVIDVQKNGPVLVATGNGVLSIDEVKPEGKRAMSIQEFSRGYGIKPGDILLQD